MPILYTPLPPNIRPPGIYMNPNDWRARALANEQVLAAMYYAAQSGRLGCSDFCFLRDRYARAEAIRSFR